MVMLQSPRIVVALDYSSIDLCMALVRQLDPQKCRLKIGKEMFTLFGPKIVELVQKEGFEVFLDLKFHDIPNTVAKAVAASAELGVWMVNVHASGGSRMMEAAKNALENYRQAPLLIAVTVLTSMEQADLAGIGIANEPQAHVSTLASLAKNASVDGVVCSAQEAAAIKSLCGQEFVTVTPGIRLAGAQADDQRRIMTPRRAIDGGSDYLVIGRPITQAEDPLQALESIYSDIS